MGWVLETLYLVGSLPQAERCLASRFKQAGKLVGDETVGRLDQQ